MATSNPRFDRRGALRLLVFCAFPIHVWTIVNMLNDVPAWRVYMTAGELLGVISYTLTYALIETLLAFLPIVALGTLLPLRVDRTLFYSISGALVLELALMAMELQELLKRETEILGVLAAYGLIFVLSVILFLRLPKIRLFLDRLAQLLWVLVVVYLAIDVGALVVVVIRNLRG